MGPQKGGALSTGRPQSLTQPSHKGMRLPAAGTPAQPRATPDGHQKREPSICRKTEGAGKEAARAGQEANPTSSQHTKTKQVCNASPGQGVKASVEQANKLAQWLLLPSQRPCEHLHQPLGKHSHVNTDDAPGQQVQLLDA
jgi:hypothetical protein